MHDFHIELKNWLVDRLSALYINYESISAGVKGPLCGAEMVPTSVYTYATIFSFRLSHLEGCLSQYWLHPPRCGVCRWCQTWSHHLNLHRLVLRGHVINTLLFIHEEHSWFSQLSLPSSLNSLNTSLESSFYVIGFLMVHLYRFNGLGLLYRSLPGHPDTYYSVLHTLTLPSHDFHNYWNTE